MQPIDVGQSGSLCLELPTAVQDTKYQQQQQQQQKKKQSTGKARVIRDCQNNSR